MTKGRRTRSSLYKSLLLLNLFSFSVISSSDLYAMEDVDVRARGKRGRAVSSNDGAFAPVSVLTAVFEGRDITFQEELVDGRFGNCGFNAIGVSRDRAVGQLIGATSNGEIRSLVGKEIKEGFIADDLPAVMRGDATYRRLKEGYLDAHQVLDELVRAFNTQLGIEGDAENLLAALRERSRDEDWEAIQEAIETVRRVQTSIDAWCEDPRIYTLYVDQYIKGGGWLAYNRGSTSSLEAIARLNNLNVYIWHRSSVNPSQLDLVHQVRYGTEAGANTIHLIHTGGLTHYNFLVETSEIGRGVVKKRGIPLLGSDGEGDITRGSYFSESAASFSDDNHFWYQVERHYDELISQVQAISEDEFKALMGRILQGLLDNGDYFRNYQAGLLHSLKENMVNWLKSDEGPLCREAFERTSSAPDVADEEDDEDSNAERNYEVCDEEEEKGDSEFSQRSPPSWEDDLIEEGDVTSTESDGYSQWQLDELESLFGISVDSLDELTADVIDEDMVEKFVTDHVEGGYSWLVNQTVEGDFEVSEDFSGDFSKVIGAPEELVSSVFGSLWFYFNWEYFDITSPTYIADTYYKTLSDFLEGGETEDIRERFVKLLYQYFFHNREDFDGIFENIKEEYEKHVKERNWQKALVIWSVYSAYQKIFSPVGTILEKDSDEEDVSTFTSLSQLNKKTSLLKKLEDARSRAVNTYTKVYPHPKTKTVIYGSKKPEKVAVLKLDKALSKLKAVGLEVEKHRPWRTETKSEKKKKYKAKSQKENIFVPRLFFIVSTKPHVKGGDHTRQFIDVPLDFSDLPRVPLTRNPKCKIFRQGFTTTAFYKMARKDVVSGKVIMGGDKVLEEEAAEKLSGQGLVHSERVLIHLLRNKDVVEQIKGILIKRLWKKNPQAAGVYKIYGAALVSYSTNTVCPNCTPSLVVLQNSHDEGFLKLLLDSLNSKDEGEISFSTRGFNKGNKKRFHLDIFVTAKVDFDEEGRDLAEDGDHSFKGRTIPPEHTHNPHAKLFFRDDRIDLYQPSFGEDKTKYSTQNFFYEFVGDTVHSGAEVSFPYTSAVFSSGAKWWNTKKGILEEEMADDAASLSLDSISETDKEDEEGEVNPYADLPPLEDIEGVVPSFEEDD